MSEQKTVREWLEELPEPYRSQALENTPICELKSDLPEASLKDALACAFAWEESPQGHDYWADLVYWKPQIHPTPTERQTAEALLKEFGDYIGYAYNNDSINKRVITDFLTSKYGKG